jgi:hypothetical protein
LNLECVSWSHVFVFFQTCQLVYCYTKGHEKWTMTIWMRQRFTTYAGSYGQLYGYSDASEPDAGEYWRNNNNKEYWGTPIVFESDSNAQGLSDDGEARTEREKK